MKKKPFVVLIVFAALLLALMLVLLLFPLNRAGGAGASSHPGHSAPVQQNACIR